MRMLKHSLENRICMQYFRVPVYLVPLKYYVKLQMASHNDINIISINTPFLNVTDVLRKLKCFVSTLMHHLHLMDYCMSVDHGEEGDKPPEFGVERTLMQIVPPLRFCHVSKFQAPDCSKHQHTKMPLVAFKIRQNAFQAGALPRSLLGELMTLPQTRWSAGKGHPSPYHAFQHSPCVPKNSAGSMPMTVLHVYTGVYWCLLVYATYVKADTLECVPILQKTE